MVVMFCSLEENITFIFRVEKEAKQETSKTRWQGEPPLGLFIFVAKQTHYPPYLSNVSIYDILRIHSCGCL
jgi:hypothetical protein